MMVFADDLVLYIEGTTMIAALIDHGTPWKINFFNMFTTDQAKHTKLKTSWKSFQK